MLRIDTLLKYKNILCVCNGGNVRSASLSTILKLVYDKNALNVGCLYIDEETTSMLTGWADIIVCFTEESMSKFPDGVLFDVGNDVWHYSRHPELVEIIREKLQMNDYTTNVMGNLGKIYKK